MRLTVCVSALYMGPDLNAAWTHVAQSLGEVSCLLRCLLDKFGGAVCPHLLFEQTAWSKYGVDGFTCSDRVAAWCCAL